MFKPIVRVVIEFAPNDFRQTCIELSEEIIEEVIQHLDIPSPSADGFARYLCTSSVEIKTVMKRREEIAKMLSAVLIDKLVSLMGAKDTEMGYERR